MVEANSVDKSLVGLQNALLQDKTPTILQGSFETTMNDRSTEKSLPVRQQANKRAQVRRRPAKASCMTSSDSDSESGGNCLTLFSTTTNHVDVEKDYPSEFFDSLPPFLADPGMRAPIDNSKHSSSSDSEDEKGETIVHRHSKTNGPHDGIRYLFSGDKTKTKPRLDSELRFPADRNCSVAQRLCRWSDCIDNVSSTAKLIEHLQTKHVNPQTFSETFICLWTGCKVFGRPSCSRSWLERHVLSHGGNKPHLCIVESCGQRFSTRAMLERHINQHFKKKDSNSRVVDSSPKLIRRNGQKLRYRRQPFSVRSRNDAFDSCIMDQLQCVLVQMAERAKDLNTSIVESQNFFEVTFKPNVIGFREEKSGDKKCLVRWFPYNCLDDEWVPMSEMNKDKVVSLSRLPFNIRHKFYDAILPSTRPRNVRQPRKYKPQLENANKEEDPFTDTKPDDNPTKKPM